MLMKTREGRNPEAGKAESESGEGFGLGLGYRRDLKRGLLKVLAGNSVEENRRRAKKG